ncbi:MAG TPA: 3-hydroxyacyl-CoA dehydrogenase family protein [Conexibacter sp.]
MSVERVLVVGAGTMGNGIAQVIAQAGLQVALVDVDAAALERAQQRIEKSIGRFVSAGKLSEAEGAATRGRIALSSDLEGEAARADHVVETVVEVFDVKRDLLVTLDGLCREEVVFASNTSQFSISQLAAATRRPDRVIGSHWFNPPPMMDLIELVCGAATSPQTLETALALAERYGKQTIVCKRDTPGFITSRLIVALGLEASRIVEEGIADVEDVNKACVLAFNHALGPLDTLDFSGLDTALRVAENMTEQYGERFLAPQNLRTLVRAGRLGRKSGHGFRDYGESR